MIKKTGDFLMEGKGNDGKGNVIERDEWETKQELWDLLNNQYNFTFDCCSNGTNSKCKSWTSNFEMYVTAGVKHTHWMNPPFSKAHIMFKHFFKIVNEGIAIFRCDNMETKIWQEQILPYASWVFIPKGRVSYTPFDTGDMRKGMGTRFPSALIGFNVDVPKGIEGTILYTKQSSDSKQD